MATAVSISDILVQRSVQERIPVGVMVELTYRCNLSCRHCYLEGSPPPREPELTTSELLELLDGLAEAGTLYLGLTGGEPLLRPDLWEILKGASERGFAPRLFTNGTLLDQGWAARLGELGTASVDLSLHGACAESHDWMTRCPGSFDAAMAAAWRLRHRGVPVTLKVPLTGRNAGERDGIRELAGRMGAQVVFDPVVSARNCGARDTWCLRLGQQEMVDLFRSEVETPPGPAELTCTAGINSAHVTPEGVVRPCVQLLLDCGSLRKESFRDIWDRSATLKMLRGLADVDIVECLRCARRELCSRCPGLALLEDGDLLGPSSAACRMALARAEAMGIG